MRTPTPLTVLTPLPGPDTPPHAATGVPVPRRLLVAGVPVTLALLAPTEPGDPQQPVDIQPMLPLVDEPTPPRGPVDADRARNHVAALARALVEVLDHRRPVAQLRSVLDEESLGVVAAWTRLGALRRCGVGPVQVMVVSPTHVEGSFTLRARDRHIAVVVALDRGPDRWRCSTLRILAPDALVTGRAA